MRRPLYGWLTATAVSLTGTRVSMVALPLFALETTGSATLTGVVALAETLPLVLLKLLGGPVIDRLGPRRVALTCDTGSLLVVASIPLLHDLGMLPFGVLLALVALAGALRGPSDTARAAMTPALAREAEVPLERATGLEGTVERTASMLGAAVGGALVAALGPADALLVDAASFGLGALVLAWATYGVASVGPAPAEAHESADDAEVDAEDGAAGPTPYLAQLREGWDFLRREPVLLGITVMCAVTNLLDAAWTTVLVPVWAVTTGGGAAAVGLLFAVFSGASALGSVTASVWAARLPRFRLYVGGFLLAGLPRFVVLALDTPTWAVLVVAIASGYAAGFLNPVLGAVEFERIPVPLVGRVSSLTNALCWSLIPFGGVLGGGLIAGLGLSPALLVVGAAYLLATLTPGRRPPLPRPGPPTGDGAPGPGRDRSAMSRR